MAVAVLGWVQWRQWTRLAGSVMVIRLHVHSSTEDLPLAGPTIGGRQTIAMETEATMPLAVEEEQ